MRRFSGVIAASLVGIALLNGCASGPTAEEKSWQKLHARSLEAARSGRFRDAADLDRQLGDISASQLERKTERADQVQLAGLAGSSWSNSIGNLAKAGANEEGIELARRCVTLLARFGAGLTCELGGKLIILKTAPGKRSEYEKSLEPFSRLRERESKANDEAHAAYISESGRRIEEQQKADQAIQARRDAEKAEREANSAAPAVESLLRGVLAAGQAKQAARAAPEPTTSPALVPNQVVVPVRPPVTEPPPPTISVGERAGDETVALEQCSPVGRSLASIRSNVACRCRKSPISGATLRITKDGAACVTTTSYIFGCALTGSGKVQCTQL